MPRAPLPIPEETKAVAARDRGLARASAALALAGVLACALPFWLAPGMHADREGLWVAAACVPLGLLLPVFALRRAGLAPLAAGAAAGLLLGLWVHALATDPARTADFWLAYVLGLAAAAVGGGVAGTIWSMAADDELRGVQLGCAVACAWLVAWGGTAFALAVAWQS
ncbi:MAG: hypothetical protein QOD77_1726 [Thermoplasmata archaeon]|jgi:hypothetical protein|nr:hypothetical protein [Thermoplasmata archaeon]